jgi:hypothetical protein
LVSDTLVLQGDQLLIVNFRWELEPKNGRSRYVSS